MRVHRSFPLLSTAAAIVLSGAVAGFAAPVQRATQPIDGRYIVVLRDGATRPADADIHDMRPTLRDLGRGLANQHGGRVGREFAAALEGYALEGTDTDAAAWAADARVAYVAEDSWVEVSAEQSSPSWGLDRVDQRGAELDGAYNYFADGTGIDLYLIDTGLRSTHVDFAGRVDLGASFTAIDDGYGTEDCNGHGTHVAGIAGGTTYGVAKGVTLHPVRVIGCSGYGAVSDIVAGIDWITARYPKPRRNQPVLPKKAVVNISLAADWSQALDDAVTRSIAAGITYVVAAGNAGTDACFVSPARVPTAITVGATNALNQRAYYSNVGSCLDLFAPGDGILSDYASDDSATMTMGGTSMAAPHVAGTVALLLAVNPALSPADVATLLRSAATAGVVADAGAGSPDRLLFSTFTGDGVDMPPVALFTASCSSGTCTLDAGPSADDRGIVAYGWDFGNGRGGNGERVSAKYGRNGPAQAIVTLTATDSVGQVTSLQMTIQTGN